MRGGNSTTSMPRTAVQRTLDAAAAEGRLQLNFNDFFHTPCSGLALSANLRASSDDFHFGCFISVAAWSAWWRGVREEKLLRFHVYSKTMTTGHTQRAGDQSATKEDLGPGPMAGAATRHKRTPTIAQREERGKGHNPLRTHHDDDDDDAVCNCVGGLSSNNSNCEV